MNAYDTTWSAVFFSLPYDTSDAKKAARRFVRNLRHSSNFVSFSGDGACLLCCSPRQAKDRLLPILPPDSRLKIVPITDKQMEHSVILWGSTRKQATTTKE